MQRLFANLSHEAVKTYALVLTASDIPFTIESAHQKFYIRVDARHRTAACRAVARYLEENPFPSADEQRDTGRVTPRTFSAVFIALLLVVIHWAVGSGEVRRLFVRSFGADAEKIVAGDLFRCVTALWLHIDTVHLLGNVFGVVVFGTVVAAHFGWGVGWLIILMAGIGGNWMTAFWYRQEHLSVGASTAVFAAVGLSAAAMTWIHVKRHERSWRSWTPLAGGLALLGMLGAAPHSDLAAHLFGFVCGVTAGMIFGHRLRPASRPIQWGCAIIGTVVVAASCYWGWVRSS
jgi:membrane associated rhomboid family serine protease